MRDSWEGQLECEHLMYEGLAKGSCLDEPGYSHKLRQNMAEILLLSLLQVSMYAKLPQVRAMINRLD